MCRRLETEEEKVLPFYASSLTDSENERVAEDMNEILTEPLCEVCRLFNVTALLYQCWTNLWLGGV